MFKKIIFAFSLMLISVYMSAENDNVHIDFSKISQGSHPRLMMNENSFDKLKEKLAVSANMAALHDGLIRELENEMKKGKQQPWPYGRGLVCI